MLYSRNEHNVVKQLYSNKDVKKIFKFLKRYAGEGSRREGEERGTGREKGNQLNKEWF